MSTHNGFRKIYGSASVLAALTGAGLLSALFGDGLWDAASWVALAVPLLVIVWKILRSGILDVRDECLQCETSEAALLDRLIPRSGVIVT